jgi:hypothetical protein
MGMGRSPYHYHVRLFRSAFHRIRTTTILLSLDKRRRSSLPRPPLQAQAVRPTLYLNQQPAGRLLPCCLFHPYLLPIYCKFPCATHFLVVVLNNRFLQKGDSAIDAAVRLLPFVVVIVVFIMLNGALLPVTPFAPWYWFAGALIIVGAVLMSTVKATTSTAAVVCAFHGSQHI